MLIAGVTGRVDRPEKVSSYSLILGIQMMNLIEFQTQHMTRSTCI